MNNRILLSVAEMGGTEQEWIEKAFKDNWIVPLGPNVDEFESRLEHFLGKGNVVALSAGTAAIHLGLVMLGVGIGDEVICQSFTFAASANPIKYQGATPVFVDSEPETWNMDPTALENAIIDRFNKTGKYPKAIIPVHLYGMPAKMDEINAIANKYSIPIVEDAAEALGSEYKNRNCGTLGDYGAFSFNGNKIITTSGGGALICPNEESASRVKFYATQARENKPYYYHNVIGYNYRLSNISAGIGCGQMEVLNHHINRRREIHKIYSDEFAKVDGIEVQQNPSNDFNSNFWLSTILLDCNKIEKSPNEIRESLNQLNIETRLLWRPMHMQPVYESAPYYGGNIAEKLFERGLCLPSSSCLTDEEVYRVLNSIKQVISK
ncbi:MAG: aminotransferase class I/II-fold pyridoxal phosphate-dependent enzyme [Muribaculaceae bacterium]|nr:aminotransferase class I/II-fold pyridoxal phosphate-dependent enzyme [Muribaculaceae bacterium]